MTTKIRIRLVCNECSRTWKVSPNAADPRCKCGSVDWDVEDDYTPPFEIRLWDGLTPAEYYTNGAAVRERLGGGR